MFWKYVILICTVQIFLTAIGVLALPSLESYPDVTIIQSDQQTLIFEWQPQDFRLKTLATAQGDFQSVSFYGASTLNETGKPDIPWREITIGIPQDAKISVQAMEQESESFTSVRLGPVPRLFKDKNGVDAADYTFDPDVYNHYDYAPQSLLRLDEPTRFRDIAAQNIHLTPLHYNPLSKTLIFFKKIRVQINYNKAIITSKSYTQRGKLDQLYEQMFLNFEQAKYWQIEAPARLRKPLTLPSGTWYRIAVRTDGLYKITPAALQSAGINTADLSVNSLQMFNNGGHMLNIQVNSAYYNPPFTSEIPIMVQDVNQNGLFDGSDYVLFYGKHVNGWFYDSASKDFTFHQHLYATENYYWLTVSGSNGSRMTKQILAEQPSAQAADFFYDRYHFEDDLYNLLASGPDWYGYRFFGRSAAYSKDFDIITNDASGAQPQLLVQLKGGSGVDYGDDLRYRYTFNIYFNNQLQFANYSFSEEARTTIQKSLAEGTILNNGKNTINFQYSGNLDGCIAHLDWFELFYPRAFNAVNDQLAFFTKEYNQDRRYRVGGFASVNDIFVFDVSNPANPVILRENMSPLNGEITFDLGALANHKNLLVSSLSSAAIRPVTSLTPVKFGQDLLSTANQADFLIITHKTFVSYAQQLADRRTHLKSKVVSTDDIYMNFNSGVQDPTALRNFIRYAYYNWQKDAPSYVLLFGDATYDYRNINLRDTMRVPTYEIYDAGEIDSRCTDNYFVDLDFNSNDLFISISPDLAIGRLPIESVVDAERIMEKIIRYEQDPVQDGWQISLIMVADDAERPKVTNEWMHQDQTESIARLSNLNRFYIKKIYLSTYPSAPGGFERIKPKAANDLIDYLNQGALMVNYVGHGSPTQWAHEAVFVMSRDLNRISNEGRLPFLVAATCDFGKFDDPHEPSFTEALVWKKGSGVIGALASTRLAFSSDNARFNEDFYRRLFTAGAPSVTLGEAKLLATKTGSNDQKYVLFADPTMHLADPRQTVNITSISPDTLKALSQIEVQGQVLISNQPAGDFSGSAMIIVNDASYDSVSTGGSYGLITLPGPLLFKGEVSVNQGQLSGRFITPKSIRYSGKKRGRIAIYSWNEQNTLSAMGYKNSLLINGSAQNVLDNEGPQIDVYFEDQENFSSGDIVPHNLVLIVKLSDQNGINITGQAGHIISLQINDETPRDISGFFVYERNSFQTGLITYPIGELSEGEHRLKLSVFDNLNNPADEESAFKIVGNEELALLEVVNYPNPFSQSTQFTFQTNRDGADVSIKIYTIAGRLIQELRGTTVSGYNGELVWDGRDRDSDEIANGVYLYKISLRDGRQKKEVIEKLVILK